MFLKTVIFAIFISGCVSISLKYLDENKDSRHRENVDHVRRKRYLGLSRRFKLNRRYQECVSLGDAQGHCKHIDFCPLNVLGTAKNVISYLCVIERAYVGVCCPDDFAAAGYGGSQLIMDLPGGAYDYESSNDTTSGCGVPIDGRVTIKDMPTSKQTTVQEWPWIAALYKPMELMKNLQQFCSGTVITDRHILTAAHCTHGIKATDIGVRLGEYNFGVINETRHTDHVVAEIIEHSDYVPGKFENDIAILRLEKPTAFNSYVWPICLPPVEGTYENKMAVVAGWGQQYYNGPLSPVLMQVAIPIWPHQQCVDAFIETIFDSNLCAAGYDGGKDSCSGDSGGPLNYQLDNGRWVVIGVVSWGIGCAQKGRPGVYTRVDHYLPWIIKNTIAQ